jgi:DNA mismatch repair protein MutL
MIRILEKNIADKIAAGEVIDRPVSVVKELVENALDAGADSITVEIRDGGRTYMRVTYNGCGIASDEAEIAFRRHATSKIADEKDLDCIETLGFRGEALASICAVARVELITKTPDAKTGRKVIVESSEILENTATGCPDGTTVTVKDLFFNVPARYKFLASDASETRKIIDFVSRIALSYPDVRFRLINGGKNIFTTSGKGNILANIISIYGADIGEGLIPVEKSRDGFMLKAHISPPDKTLPSRNRQIFCVNGRIIASAVMERALDRAYAERMFKGRFPIAFLFLAMPASKLDVNIHPTKKQIRFDDNSEVEDFVTEAIHDALTGEKAVPDVSKTIVERAAAHLKDDGFTYQAPDSVSIDMK